MHDLKDKIRNHNTTKKAKEGVSKVIFSRAMLIIAFLAFQILFMAATITWFEQYQSQISVANYILKACVVIYMINQPVNPSFKITWILLVMIFPLFGTVFYVFVQVNPGSRKVKKKLTGIQNDVTTYLKQDRQVIADLRANKPANANLARYLDRQVGYPVYRNTKATYFPFGEDKFLSLLEELEKAEKFIFMEYFIIEEGYMWGEILEILKKKARAGVEVRVMYDGTCAIAKLPYNYPRKLQAMGIQAKMFNPMRPVLSTAQNNRDHRKICVIDGKTAYTGGINLGDEYINQRERYGVWKDTAVMLKGEAVSSFTVMFLKLWNVDLPYNEDYSEYLSAKSHHLKRELGFTIPFGDSPFDEENVGEEVYFHILNHAKKYVHIMTPYLIIDSEMVATLQRAAKAGIEVIIIMPHIPDKKYVFWLAKSFYTELLDAGVRIYEYTPGFVHAKVFVSDDDTAVVGTINLDYRSLYLHFECGAFFYQNTVVKDVEKDFQKTLRHAQEITPEEVKKRPFRQKAVGEVLRLIGPLM